MPEASEFYVGLDVVMLPRMLVGVHALALLFDVSTATIRRWAQQGVMPKPRVIRGRRLWSADELRKWIADNCPDLGEGQK